MNLIWMTNMWLSLILKELDEKDQLQYLNENIPNKEKYLTILNWLFVF